MSKILSKSEDSQAFTLSGPSAQASSQFLNVAACSARCNKHCSYPGHNNHYRDSNGDNLCDSGQCL